MIEEQNAIEVVYERRTNNDNWTLLSSRLPRSDEPEDLKEIQREQNNDEEQKRMGRRWFYLILLCTIVSSAVVVAVILTGNRTSDSVPAVSASLVASSTPQPSPSTPQTGSKQPTPPIPSKIPEPPYTVILESGASMSRNEISYSPNGLYSLYMDPDEGDLTMSRDDDVVWRVNGEGATTCIMQTDGNLLLRAADRTVTWRANTSGNQGATLRLDNAGQLTVLIEEGTPVWLAGVPQGHYSIGDTASLDFPIRAAFYYPWFPETWSVNGSPVKYTPTLGLYGNGHATVQRAHVDMLVYSNVNVAIASWWGPNTHLDRSRITNLLNKSKGKSLKWTIYHEEQRDQTIDEIRADLSYVKKWFAWHENWAHVDGRPLLFVYNGSDCDTSERWMAASSGEWYVVLKSFRDHDDCPVQPDHWHEHGPANAVVHEPGYSFSISPGFWRADQNTPVLARLSTEEWRSNVMDMVNSKEPWQLIATFNGWGDGTAVEGATEWSGSSDYGRYVDVLHDIQ